MARAARHDPYVRLGDDAQIVAGRQRRQDATDTRVRATEMMTLTDRMMHAVRHREQVTVATKHAGDVAGVLTHVAARFVQVDEPEPVPRIVLIPTGEIVWVRVQHLAAEQIDEAAGIDQTTTLLTMLETTYSGEAVELTLTNGVTVCAPVAAFGDDMLMLQVGEGSVACVAASEIALAAIPPPRRQDLTHTGG